MDKYKVYEESKQRKSSLNTTILSEYKTKFGGGILEPTKKQEIVDILKKITIETK